MHESFVTKNEILGQRAVNEVFWDYKNPNKIGVFVAERERFELSIPLRGITVFETVAFNHSATSPRRRLRFGLP